MRRQFLMLIMWGILHGLPVGSPENDLDWMSFFGPGVSRLPSIIEGSCLAVERLRVSIEVKDAPIPRCLTTS